MSSTLTLSNPNNYVRISLSGIFQAPFDGTTRSPHAHLSIERDSTDLGQGEIITTDNVNAIPVGITMTDSPGDTNSHTYRAMFDNGGGGTQTASFTASPLAYLLLEEIAR